ncbi:Spx/MgsR family RNA polymerase-binding regulatory protein [Emticicia sp. BO119]|uniref:Spx/MgsR family RNA polymerase-binding regulatory protein n=1 Tax=Emticicia sp. BO119 TaxID=2757768 RepID=UPI0015EFEE84|nr:Spx/MgsR family RNA polymerase-binding regulatory protein [Emticicia sp. BO119]MBA4850851.1 Spx/MgsR family RNA polymerase-binding regulatory protein [Emticicia sp. BO119]
MITIYGIPNCDMIKKTMDWFKTNNIAYDFHDYRKEGIGAEKLKEWLSQVPLDTIFNKNSTTYKELPAEIKDTLIDEESAIKAMMGSTSIIKRPVVDDDGKVMAVGFKADKFKAIFTPEAQ